MLDKCEEGTRCIHRNQFESAIVPNAFSVSSARRDERESRESRPGDETTMQLVLNQQKFGIATKFYNKTRINQDCQ